MSKTINYVVTHDTVDFLSTTSPLSLPDVGYDLEPFIKTIDSNKIYTNCPIWAHKAKRIYLVKSPFDFEIHFNRQQKKLHVDGPKIDQFIFIQDGWDYHNPIIQLRAPCIVAWTNHKNIWVESRPHAPAAANNNFVGFSGWWNLSNWSRPILPAGEMLDETKPIIFKRGQPIFELLFYSTNLNDDFKLVRHNDIPEKLINQIKKSNNVKRFVTNLSSKLIFNKQESKCPFSRWL